MRETIVRKTCTVSGKRESRLYADDKCELMYFLRGDVRVRVSGRDYVPQPGDLLLFGSGELHSLTVNPGQPFERISVFFDREFFRRLSDGNYDLLMSFNLEDGSAKSNLIRAKFVRACALDEKLRSMYELGCVKTREAAVMGVSELLTLLVSVNDAHRQQRLTDGEEPEEFGGSDKIREVLRYIVGNLNEKFTLDGLAARFYISKYYLCHEFKRAVGVPCLEYIRQKRIEKARELLLDGRPVNDIWPELGFGDYMSFYRTFKKTTGLAPNEYVWTERANASGADSGERGGA